MFSRVINLRQLPPFEMPDRRKKFVNLYFISSVKDFLETIQSEQGNRRMSAKNRNESVAFWIEIEHQGVGVFIVLQVFLQRSWLRM